MNALRHFFLMGWVLVAVAGCVPAGREGDVDWNTKSKEIVLIENPSRDDQGKIVPVQKTPEAWQAELTDQEYRVLRESGTERSGTGRYLENKKEGVYACAGCGLALFESKAKFDSGTGWPSFYQPIAKDHVASIRDETHGMVRVENRCARCDGHLGHVFNDGPAPTGERYCMNGYALRFVEGR
ncbi:MAG: peptide-methionine (R)-S-oxide reductase MsrB [Algisphaera sp.]